MPKIVIFCIIIMVAAGGVLFFLLTQEEDPIITQAKAEVQRANEAYLAFQNTVSALPLLQISQDVKNDFKMEAGYFGILGNFQPEKAGFSPASMLQTREFLDAVKKRASSELSFDFNKDFSKFLTGSVDIYSVTYEDLQLMERRADAFDEALKRAKVDTPELVLLTVARDKDTEKYFLEFDQIGSELKTLAAKLDEYSSADFRSRIGRLKSANEDFIKVVQYSIELYRDGVRSYSLNIAETFPEVEADETAIMNCFKWYGFAPPPECQPVGFLPGKYQALLLNLQEIFSKLAE